MTDLEQPRGIWTHGDTICPLVSSFWKQPYNTKVNIVQTINSSVSSNTVLQVQGIQAFFFYKNSCHIDNGYINSKEMLTKYAFNALEPE